MITLTDVSLRRGEKLLFDHANLTIYPGNKIGIIGANGAGKTSLFAMISGQLTPDTGDISLPQRLVFASVAQETPLLNVSALEFTLSGDHLLCELQKQLVAAEIAHDGHLIARLHAELDAVDGYTAPHRAAQLLSGLGFSVEQQLLPVAHFSGGWRMRLNLASALMCRSDVLLLDEPTNHLDLDAIYWLEQWLAQYRGTLLVISHDRDFLDNIAQQIVHLSQKQIQVYNGNYSQFERQQAERLAQQQASYAKQQRERAHMESFVARFRAQATKARQAQSRLKALARMDVMAAVHVDSPFRFSFYAPEKLPHPLLQLRHVSAGYGEHRIVNNVTMILEPGARIGFLGYNGAGKSTLLKVLAGEIAPLGGERLESANVRVGYFAQHQLEQLDYKSNSLQHLLRLSPTSREQELRNFLGQFGFHGDEALRTIDSFSGGEKARLALALLVWQKPTLLFLDEPTNHLDLDMREALILALQEFPGAMVIISHDRHLLRTTVDEFVLVANGKVQPFDGDLDDYRDWLLASREQNSSATNSNDPSQESSANRKQRKRDEAQQRQESGQKRRPLEQKCQQLEKQIAEYAKQKSTLLAQLSDTDLYSEAKKAQLKECLKKQSELDKAVAEAEDAWLLAHDELDKMT